MTYTKLIAELRLSAEIEAQNKGSEIPDYEEYWMAADAIEALLARLEKAEKDTERCKRFIDAMCEETFDTWTNGYRMQRVAMNIQRSMNITAAMEASK